MTFRRLILTIIVAVLALAFCVGCANNPKPIVLPGVLPVSLVQDIAPGVVVAYFGRIVEMGDGQGGKAVLVLEDCEGPNSDPLKGGMLIPHTFVYHSGRRCRVAYFEPIYSTGGGTDGITINVR